jgi:hypothetical protein
MKFTTALPLLIAMGASSTSAFMVPSNMAVTSRPTRLQVVSEPPMEDAVAKKVEEEPEFEVVNTEPKVEEPVAVVDEAEDPRKYVEPGRFDNIDYSLTLPFLKRPTNLDGSHAGDYGFDPLGFTESYDMYYMQECELRHARLAMLAVAGWPLSELIAPKFMLQNGCAPSVLNGVNPLTFITIAGAFAAFGFLEYQTSLRQTVDTKLGDQHLKDMSKVWKYGVAGDYNFDPLNLYSSLGDDAAGRKGLRTLEITQGRYAMLGITYFAFWEALTGSPIVKDNMFFEPNLLLPFLGASYFAWSQIYQVSDLRKAPIKIEYTKDGEDILRNLDRSTAGIRKEIVEKVEPYLSDIEVPLPSDIKMPDIDEKMAKTAAAVVGGVATVGLVGSTLMSIPPSAPQNAAPPTPPAVVKTTAKVAAPAAPVKAAATPFFATEVKKATPAPVAEVKKATPAPVAEVKKAAPAPVKASAAPAAVAPVVTKKAAPAPVRTVNTNTVAKTTQTVVSKEEAQKKAAEIAAAKAEAQAAAKAEQSAAQAKASTHAFGVTDGNEYGGKVLPSETISDDVRAALKKYTN